MSRLGGNIIKFESDTETVDRRGPKALHISISSRIRPTSPPTSS